MATSHSSRLGSIALTWLLKGLRVGVVAYLGVMLVLLFLENWLVYPAPRFPLGNWEASHLPHEDVYFQSADGTQLHGWFVEHPQPRGVILYFHGNGEHIAYNDGLLLKLRDELRVSVFAFDYRGYGRSAGQPSEAGIHQDAQAAQEWLVRRTGCAPQDIVLMGRSLGGGVAVGLAAKRGARGLILESTFSSLPDAAAAVFPWLPVRWLMRNRYDSLTTIRQFHGPLLQSHGDCDTLIPLPLAEKLHAAAAGPKEFFIVRGGDHNCAQPAEYYQRLDAFLDRLERESPKSNRN